MLRKKKCNNPLHQKQIDGKANNISPPRGGEGKKEKRGRAIPSNLSYPLPPLWLLCRLTTLWGTEYHCLSLLTILKGQAWPACIASVSVRFRSKERGTRVKWHKEKSGVALVSFLAPRGQNRESRSSVFLCSKTKRKRLLCRLPVKWINDHHHHY